MPKPRLSRHVHELLRALREIGAILSRLGHESSSPADATGGALPGIPPDGPLVPTGATTARLIKPLTLVDFLAAANLSTSRSRAMVFIISIASIVAFAAAWKSMPFGWYDARLRRTLAAIDYLEWKENLDAQHASKPWYLALWPPPSAGSLDARQVRRREALGFTDESRWKEHLNEGKEVAAVRQYVDAQHARAYLNALDQLRIEGVDTVHIPIIGITFDINDLGMIAGIVFIVLLVTLRLALDRELHNVRIAFDVAGHHHPALEVEVYEYLSMGQVMTLPPHARARPKPPSFWVRAPMLLIWLPFIVQTIIVGNDVYTTHIGEVTSTGMTKATLLLGFASAFVILILTGLCWHLSGAIDHEWLEKWRKIRRHEEQRVDAEHRKVHAPSN